MDYTSQVKTVVEEIIERGYFDEETLQFKDFWVDLIQINDVNVYYNSLQTSININAAINDDINTINLYDLDIENYEPNKPVILSTDIKTSKLYSSAIQIKTYTDSFSVNVEKALQIYFNNNTKLQFNVETSENEIEIILPSTIQKESYTTIVIISGLIVGFGVLCSAVVFYLNECKKDYIVDNAKYLAPLLFSLQLYDFISDINLTYDIFNNPLSNPWNIVFICGIASAVFTIIPFIVNLASGILIKKQDVIKKNKRADTYFSTRGILLIILIVISGGTYPSLQLVSSNIYMFNKDIFQSGLSKNDLDQLSKIKIRTTIALENVPQLIIQIIYAFNTKDITTPVYLAFIGSLLSVIMAVAAYCMNNINRQESEIQTYDIKFCNNKLTIYQQENIEKRKGRKDKLQKRMATILGDTGDQIIELGYAKIIEGKGVQFTVDHYLTQSELDTYEEKYNKMHNHAHGIHRMKVESKQYLRYLYQEKKKALNNCFRKHFSTDNINFGNQFVVEYIDDYTQIEMTSNYNVTSGGSNGNDEMKYNSQQPTQVDIMKDNNTNNPLNLLQMEILMNNMFKKYMVYSNTNIVQNSIDVNGEENKMDDDELVLQTVFVNQIDDEPKSTQM